MCNNLVSGHIAQLTRLWWTSLLLLTGGLSNYVRWTLRSPFFNALCIIYANIYINVEDVELEYKTSVCTSTTRKSEILRALHTEESIIFWVGSILQALWNIVIFEGRTPAACIFHQQDVGQYRPRVAESHSKYFMMPKPIKLHKEKAKCFSSDLTLNYEAVTPPFTIYSLVFFSSPWLELPFLLWIALRGEVCPLTAAAADSQIRTFPLDSFWLLKI